MVFSAFQTNRLREDHKLSNIELLGCHGMGDDLADGETFIRPQTEPDPQFADGDLRIPHTQDLLNDSSHSSVVLKNTISGVDLGLDVTRKGTNVYIKQREHGGKLEHSLREDAGSQGIYRANPLQDVE